MFLQRAIGKKAQWEGKSEQRPLTKSVGKVIHWPVLSPTSFDHFDPIVCVCFFSY